MGDEEVTLAIHGKDIAEIKAALARIEAQTTATNGRVRSLERWKLGLTTALAGLIAGSIGGSDLVHRIIAAVVGGS